jgi:hypothetical protein
LPFIGIDGFLSGTAEQLFMGYMRAFIRSFIQSDSWVPYRVLFGFRILVIIASFGLPPVGGVSPILIGLSSTVMFLEVNVFPFGTVNSNLYAS